MCGSRKNIHTHPEEGHWKFQGGGGLSQVKICKGNCNFQRDVGFKPKNLWEAGRGRDFLEQHNVFVGTLRLYSNYIYMYMTIIINYMYLISLRACRSADFTCTVQCTCMTIFS